MNVITQLWHHLTHGADGKPSTLTLWTSVAYATATFVVVKQTLDSTLSTELFLVYLGVVGGHTFAARAFNTYMNRGHNGTAAVTATEAGNGRGRRGTPDGEDARVAGDGAGQRTPQDATE